MILLEDFTRNNQPLKEYFEYLDRETKEIHYLIENINKNKVEDVLTNLFRLEHAKANNIDPDTIKVQNRQKLIDKFLNVLSKAQAIKEFDKDKAIQLIKQKAQELQKKLGTKEGIKETMVQIYSYIKNNPKKILVALAILTIATGVGAVAGPLAAKATAVVLKAGHSYLDTGKIDAKAIAIGAGLALVSGSLTNIFHHADADIDKLVDTLKNDGDINATDVSLEGLPEGLNDDQIKIAKALRAIEKSKFVDGQNVSSYRESEVYSSIGDSYSIEGDVKVSNSGSKFVNNISIKTANGKLELAHLNSSSITTEVDGKITNVETSDSGGIQSDIARKMKNLTPRQELQLRKYIYRDQELLTGQSATSQKFAISIFNNKKEDFAAMIAIALQGKPDGNYKVKIDKDGPVIKKI